MSYSYGVNPSSALYIFISGQSCPHSSFLFTVQFRQKAIRGSSPSQKNSPKEHTLNTFKLIIINLKTVKKKSHRPSGPVPYKSSEVVLFLSRIILWFMVYELEVGCLLLVTHRKLV